MKRFLHFILIASLLSSCVDTDIEVGNQPLVNNIPDAINISLDDDTTRVQLDANGKTVWTEDDCVSAFYMSDANNKFRFNGETGDRSGKFVIESMGSATTDIDHIVLLYPYSSNYKLNASKSSIGVYISPTQYYEEGSYGVGSNLMASVETNDNFTLKSLCGWIVVQLKGDATITSITLTGNNGEQLAGDANFDYEKFNLNLVYYPEDSNIYGDSNVGGSLVWGECIESVTLDCGDGIELNPNQATEFYFVVPPQIFTKGITIEAECLRGDPIVKKSSKALTVKRNHIVPMTTITANEVVPNNQIWYTSTDGDIIKPNDYVVSGATLISNTCANGTGVLTFSSDVITIEEDAFSYCDNLESITLPNCLTSIRGDAFYECESLTSITIPDSVTTIGVNAFGWCYNLTNVYISDIAAWCNITFYSSDSNPLNSGANLYLNNKLVTDLIIPDNVTSIGDLAFIGCKSLTNVTIGDSVTTIGDLAFIGCKSLTSVNIPDSVAEIGYEAFRKCKSLTSINIPDSVTWIGECAFEDCISLQEFKGKFASEDGRCLIIDGVLNSFALGCGATEYTIPNSVTTIGKSAFSLCSSLTSVTIPDSVTTIGDYAICECSSLTSVTIGDSVTEIGEWAFAYCSSLTSVYCKATTPPAGGSSMFSGNASGRKFYVPMGSVEAYRSADGWSEYADSIIPYDFEKGEVVAYQELTYTATSKISLSITALGDANILYNKYDATTGVGVIGLDREITTIGEYTFYGYSSLTSVTIPDSVTTIGKYAFSCCSSLTSVTIPDSVISIGKYAFEGCTGELIIYSKIIENNYTSKPDWLKGAKFTKLTIGDSVTTIGDYAFDECTSLTSITIPDSVTSIGDYAFYYCISLTSVIIPDSVTTIGEWAFSSCSSLTSITIPDSVTKIGNYAFCDCDSLTSVTIPDSVTTIGEYAFLSCDSLTSVTIPDSVTTIEDGAFSSCSSLISVTIPDSVTTIGEDAFYECTSLTSVTIPDSVTSIGGSAFKNCTSLTSITIPDSVTTIGRYAFEGCTGELTVNCNIPSASYSYDGAFNDSKFTKVTIGDSVTTIGDYAFCYCSSLTSVTIPDSVTTIGEGAFYNCTKLANITIPDSVTTIGHDAFYGCRSITSVTIPDSVTTIGEGAFCGCRSLTSVTIPDSVTTIGGDVFYGCSSLTSVTIPDSVTEIGYRAFYDCSSLTSVTIPNSVTTIGGYSFSYCYSLTSVTIPDSVTSIGYDAFMQCTSLTSVTIPDSVTEISYEAFKDCSKLKEVYCKPTTPPTGGYDMFDYNASGRKIYVPSGAVRAYKSANYWRDYASDIVGYDFENGEIVEGNNNGSYTVTLNNAWRKSTSVFNPDSSLYDGVYESYSNYNINNGVATMYIDITGYNEFSIFVRSDAESKYDYVTVYDLDSTTSAKMTTKGNQQSSTSLSSYTAVIFSNIDGGSHRIAIEYSKDNSQHSGTDRGYVLIPKY